MNERRVTNPERERVIEALCEHYAQDHLELPELERRLDRANRVEGLGELEELLNDLPAEPAGGRGALAAGEAGGEADPHGRSRAPAVPPGAGRVPAARVQPTQTEVAVWSGRVRSGSWIPARTVHTIVFMGGVDLDFREALFGPDPVEVRVAAIMGGVEIIVPPGIHVDTRGFALLGGFEEQLEGSAEIPPDAPRLTVTGFALMGGVEIVTRLPGESARQARRRRKEESRRRREERDLAGDAGRRRRLPGSGRGDASS